MKWIAHIAGKVIERVIEYIIIDKLLEPLLLHHSSNLFHTIEHITETFIRYIKAHPYLALAITLLLLALILIGIYLYKYKALSNPQPLPSRKAQNTHLRCICGKQIYYVHPPYPRIPYYDTRIPARDSIVCVIEQWVCVCCEE